MEFDLNITQSKLESVETVGDFESLIPGSGMYLGFDKLDPDLKLREIQTTSKCRINVVDTLRIEKLKNEEYISTNLVYYSKILRDHVEVYGIKLDDFEDPVVEEEEFDEFTPLIIRYDEILINDRYPDYSNFVLFKGVRIYPNRYNTANGLLIRKQKRYIFVADSIIMFNFPEPIIDFYSYEIGFFPGFFARSENYVYFINQDKLIKYSNFNVEDFEAKFLADNYISDLKIERRVVIADVLNVFRFGELPDPDTVIDALIIEKRLNDENQTLEKLEVYESSTLDDNPEFDYDEAFEIWYY